MKIGISGWTIHVPPTYLGLAAIFLAVSSAAFLSMYLLSRRARAKTSCAWMKDRMQPHAERTRWRCAACGQVGYGKGRKPPVTCLRHLRSGL